jgi:multidrug efflux pump subunit AcrA (membrane-fusion protein)
MSTVPFLVEWALRSMILIAIGVLLLWALRVKDPSIRWAAWTAMLCASLAIPVLTLTAPALRMPILRAAAPHPEASMVPESAAPELVPTPSPLGGAPASPHTGGPRRFDWALAALLVYIVVALSLLVRLTAGLAFSRRLRLGSRATGRRTEEIEILESNRVTAPVVLGIARPIILLPQDWAGWDQIKLDAVLAHERSHIRRHDTQVQLLSAIHRALLWHSPLSWFLHQRIVRTAEEASDAAAVAAIGDRTVYAELLLEFIRRGLGKTVSFQVPMARYGRPEQRIQRILDGNTLSRGVARWTVASIVGAISTLAYLVAAAHPSSALPAQTSLAAPVRLQAVPETPAPALPAQTGGASEAPPTKNPDAGYLSSLGAVTAFNTVNVKPRVEGELTSVSFKEGDLVHEGELLASIDPRAYQLQLTQAEGQLEQDCAGPCTNTEQRNAIGPGVEGKIKADQALVDAAKLRLSFTQINSPITGVAGLRLIDPGNIVHPGDTIVVVAQLQPISVFFNIAEDFLPQFRARLSQNPNLPAEIWNRENSAKIASCRVTAVDNMIDAQIGTAKIKAVCDNKDGALFPNQFVNVRVRLPGSRALPAGGRGASSR